MTMDRGAAHAAIVLILHNHYRPRTATNSSFSGVADDILDALEALERDEDDGPHPDGIVFEKPILNDQGIIVGYKEVDPTQPP